MRYFIRSILSTFFFLLSFFKKREGITVLMYHRVNDALPPSDLVTPVKKFREQMQYLKEHCEVIGSDKLIDIANHNWKIGNPKKTRVLITFDDGYRDNYLNAYPILKEFGLSAIIFITTGLMRADKEKSNHQSKFYPDRLSWDEVYEMALEGIIFGAHTVSHPCLSQLNHEEQKKEIEGSIMIMSGKSLVVNRQLLFCYPFGKYNEHTLQILYELGVRFAFTTKPGINNERVNLLELKRTKISGVDSIFDFRKKLAGAFDWIRTHNLFSF